MAEPRPLTQTPAANLDWSRPSAPVATDFGDIYFSTDGGLDETRAVFLHGCGLPEGWSDHVTYTISELGFGSGLNFLATWQLWSQTAGPIQRLHFVSIEKFPFDSTQLKQALGAWPELEKLSAKLIEAWPGRVKGIHRLNFGSVTLTLIHDNVIEALDKVSDLQTNAWFLDGFNPSGNPAMWSQDVMRRIAAYSAAGARLATFSVAGTVRSALTEAGFTVRKMPGFGRKRHRLEAELPGTALSKNTPIEKALIVGAGIAGFALAQELSTRHIPFDIIDDRSHPAASRNPAVLIKPRFDLQDRPESRFFLAAYLQALRLYPDHAILSRGIRQLPKTKKDSERYQKLAEQAPLGAGQWRWDIDDQGDGALWIENAIVLDPVKLFQNLEVLPETYAPEKGSSAKYSHVFIASGYGIRTLAPALEFRYSRGQLSWAKPIWDSHTAYGGYALNLGKGALVGATYDRLDMQDPFEIRPEDDAKNLNALRDISGLNVTALDYPSRASIRVTTRDTLPVIADLGNGHWALSGLGSRGFTFAPLLANAMISQICGEVGPLEKGLRDRFSDLSRLS